MSMSANELKPWPHSHSVDDLTDNNTAAGAKPGNSLNTTIIISNDPHNNNNANKDDIAQPGPGVSAGFGNPAPIALIGLVLALTPFSFQLMGWRGSDSNGYANNGANLFCGGLLLLTGGLLELFIGHTFASAVYCAYGSYFFAFGATLMPAFNAITPYITAEGVKKDFFNGFGFFHLFVGLLSLFFLICSVRTNIVLVILFVAATISFPLSAAADWHKGQAGAPNMRLINNLETGSGACCLIISMCGWYALLGSLFQSVDFPCELPMGDLSTVIKGASERKRLNRRRSQVSSV
ncbi:GPR1/FUN34/yaaH family-domain-containing protein [Sphaerosporella brunnea]|uniref:GPR1/FUN34/yaaH family-domain-containing protein n=1 Tax=Sphaerosporella brunnea TaxID=1250544 RepID=A0A5J5ENA2_9PEZI|nr:GPR1/FUN34/yaaH family-domain-containing protein [Sphaerosporella brunnea]